MSHLTKELFKVSWVSSEILRVQWPGILHGQRLHAGGIFYQIIEYLHFFGGHFFVLFSFF